MDMADVNLDEIRSSIGVFERESTISKRSRSINLGPYVDEISEYGYQYGFNSSELERLLKAISIKNEVDQSSLTTLLKNLYPAERVPPNICVIAIGSLGQGSTKPSFATQSGILRWMCNIQQLLEEPEFLLRFYSVLFNHLDILALRTPLCNLLVLITRRRHVRPFRIQKLLTLCQQFGNDPPLVSVLKVYKNFYPDIILNGPVLKRSFTLTQQDSEWKARLLAIQNTTSSVQGRSTSTVGGFSLIRNGTRKRNAMIPEVHTFRAPEASIILEDIDSVESFVNNLERIEPPSQLIAGLGDPLVQRYLLLNKSAESVRRLEFWLETSLEMEIEIIEEGFGLSPTLTEILSTLLSYTEFTKELHPVAEKFFMTYLPLWDGSTNLGTILDLLSYLRPRRLQEIHKAILAPLETAVLHGALSPFETIFDFYSKLVPRWVNITASSSPRNQNALIEMRTSLEEITNHISTIALSALTTSGSPAFSILTYYITITTSLFSEVSRAIDARKPITIPISIPTAETFYLLLFTSSPNILSQLCGLLAQLKQLLESLLRSNNTLPDSLSRTLNGYLMDTCNLLWRSRAFATADANARACLLPEASIAALRQYAPRIDRDASLAGLFGLSWHPLLGSMARAAFLEMESEMADKDGVGELEVTHEGPVSQRSLVVLANDGGVQVEWKEYRGKVLDWMEERGIGGVKGLIFAALKNAMA